MCLLEKNQDFSFVKDFIQKDVFTIAVAFVGPVLKHGPRSLAYLRVLREYLVKHSESNFLFITNL